MPELPEVETVRRGLTDRLTGVVVAEVEVRAPRSIREHAAGGKDFGRRLRGLQFPWYSRRGKFLWVPLAEAGESTGEALVMHLGMSGQALIVPSGTAAGRHCRVRLAFEGHPWELHFADQRMFGGMMINELVSQPDGERIPARVEHIARDALDPKLDLEDVVADLRRRSAGIKSLLLNQQVIAGIGNIYADEALWRARVHHATPGNRMSRVKLLELLGAAQEVMSEAVALGGTSFDAQYVDVDGVPGWFSVELNAYGRQGDPCRRCGRLIIREAFANRSAFRCPRCQPPRKVG